MTETASWETPECPFVIEYSTSTLDDIRLAVVDAFFSLPRGGAEIGGLLLGGWDEGRLVISSHMALDCEHAFGPSFALSPRDESILAGLIATSETPDTRVVGWYHSHTRSEIFLSEADLDIHRRFFPEAWQVALVVKPHTFLPARAGFFFRDSSGAIRNNATYREITLQPMAVQPAPRASAASAAVIDAPVVVQAAPMIVDAAPVVDTPAVVDAPPVEMPAAHAEPPPDSQPAAWLVQEEPAAPPQPGAWNLAPEREPQFPPPLPPREPHSPRPWRKIALSLATAAALGGLAYATRASWMPSANAKAYNSPAAIPASLGLNTLDADGQLQIRWDTRSPALLHAPGGVLLVGEGGAAPQRIALDQPHLLSGVFTIARQSERVDVSLSVVQPDGAQVHEATNFSGKLPDRAPKDEPPLQKERDDLAKQVAKMKTRLDEEIQRNHKLQRSVDALNKQLRDQQRTRMLNQASSKR
jgi:proteasome lid subunit RPN8/RPN11